MTTAISVTRAKGTQGESKKITLFTQKTETVEMSIAPEMFAEITKQLTDVYTNPLRSAVREVISNALDASENGHIDITPPSNFNPQVVIRDCGVGMSREDIISIYSQYGSSTKKNNFNAIGAKGVGAKAPLAYTNSFSVVTIKDGLKTAFIVTRGNGMNEVELSETVPTEEHSGTTVTIPIQDKDIETVRELITVDYRKYDIDNRININARELDTPNAEETFLTLTELPFTDETTGETVSLRVLFNRKLIYNQHKLQNTASYVANRSHRETPLIDYIIGGYCYQSYDYSYRKADITVELKPGFVNFSTSREEITRDERLENFNELIHTALKEKFEARHDAIEELIRRNIDKLTDQEILRLALHYPPREIRGNIQF